MFFIINIVAFLLSVSCVLWVFVANNKLMKVVGKSNIFRYVINTLLLPTSTLTCIALSDYFGIYSSVEEMPFAIPFIFSMPLLVSCFLVYGVYYRTQSLHPSNGESIFPRTYKVYEKIARFEYNKIINFKNNEPQRLVKESCNIEKQKNFASYTNGSGEFLLCYEDYHDNYSERDIDIISVDDKYITAFCYSRNDIRTFSLHRVISCINKTTGEDIDPYELIYLVY